jgi:outer membrane protein assembly factor BamA
VYDEQVLTEDLERVRAFYRKHGYQDVDVSSQVYRDPSGRGLYVHLALTEGLRETVAYFRASLERAQLERARLARAEAAAA